MDRKRSCPAVSQICSRTLQSDMTTFLIRKEAPMVVSGVLKVPEM